jgi:hypothetical protein
MIPQTIKVIKNNARYYTSFLASRQTVYAFEDDTQLNKCKRFLERYKERYSTYPPAKNGENKIVTRFDEGGVYVVEENTELLQRYCLMYNVGLSSIKRFDFDFSANSFIVDVSAEDILPEIDHKQRAELLNYALILS